VLGGNLAAGTSVRILLLILTLLCAAGAVYGQSKAKTDRGQTSAQSAPPPVADQRGTDQMPLSIKIVPGSISKEESAKQESERAEKADIDKKVALETQRVADYTWWLGFFSFALCMIAMAQAALFIWQLGYMRQSMKDATTAAQATRRSAIATVAQAKIARDTLVKSQRPYIFVYGIERLMTRNDVRGLTPFVEYIVANFGQTPAILENVGAGFHQGELPTAPLRIDDDHPLFVAPILPPGEKRMELKELLPEAFVGEDLGVIVDLNKNTTHPLPKFDEDKDFFFRIIVYYKGPFSDGHKTSATWRYNRSLNQFVQFGGKDYNYAE
jgi:hypothetical protein